MGSAFQRESISAGSNTAVQCMQECSTFSISRLLPQLVAPTQSIASNQDIMGQPYRLHQIAPSVGTCWKNKRFWDGTTCATVGLAGGGMAVAKSSRNVSAIALSSGYACLKQVRITGGPDQIEDQQHSLSVSLIVIFAP